jgi:hypothetical protein
MEPKEKRGQLGSEGVFGFHPLIEDAALDLQRRDEGRFCLEVSSCSNPSASKMVAFT